MRRTLLVVGESLLGSDELRRINHTGRRALEMIGWLGRRILTRILSAVGRIEVRHGRRRVERGYELLRLEGEGEGGEGGGTEGREEDEKTGHEADGQMESSSCKRWVGEEKLCELC